MALQTDTFLVDASPPIFSQTVDTAQDIVVEIFSAGGDGEDGGVGGGRGGGGGGYGKWTLSSEDPSAWVLGFSTGTLIDGLNGGNGIFCANGRAGGTGGSGSAGGDGDIVPDVVHAGGNGGAVGTTGGGGGGEAASATTNGNNGSNGAVGVGGAGGTGTAGANGGAGGNALANGVAGSNYGGGGGGAGSTGTGGAAGAAKIVITYTVLAVAPTVTTGAATLVTESTATVAGNVTSDGGATVTQRGICWATHSSPTTGDTTVVVAGTTGAFSGNLTGLPADTPIYTKAYATNSAGTSYGAATNFTTSAPPTITITSPTTDATYTTAANTVAVSGTAADDIGINSVTWTNDRGGSGVATGTTAWSIAAIGLFVGANVITVTAVADNQTTDAVITVECTIAPGSLRAATPANGVSGSNTITIRNLNEVYSRVSDSNPSVCRFIGSPTFATDHTIARFNITGLPHGALPIDSYLQFDITEVTIGGANSTAELTIVDATTDLFADTDSNVWNAIEADDPVTNPFPVRLGTQVIYNDSLQFLQDTIDLGYTYLYVGIRARPNGTAPSFKISDTIILTINYFDPAANAGDQASRVQQVCGDQSGISQ